MTVQPVQIETEAVSGYAYIIHAVSILHKPCMKCSSFDRCICVCRYLKVAVVAVSVRRFQFQVLWQLFWQTLHLQERC